MSAGAADPLWLGRDLLESGAITAEQFASAREHWRKHPREDFPAVLERLGLALPRHLAAALAKRHALPLAQTGGRCPDAAVARLIPAETAKRKGLVPLGVEEGRLTVAVADPSSYGEREAAQDFPGRAVRLQVAPRAEILGIIDESWRAPTRGSDPHEHFERLVREAVAEGASDLHLEPRERGIDVRLRIDGALVHRCFVDQPQREAFLQAAKIAGRMDIAERRLPQDGRGCVVIGAHTYHLRFSCIPAVNGESIVVRILEDQAGMRPLDDMQLSATDHDHLKSLLGLPNGLVFVTGPTGAGKTTLLYSLLGALPQRDLNSLKVVTLEEPVEWRHPRFFLQIDVDERIGRGFAEVLRHVLRHDPDILLVGETRDRATAEITLRAALAGRLCFSTLHTNSAIGAIARLTEMGLDPLLLSSALKGVIAQRLIRRPCPRCCRPHPRAQLWRQRYQELLGTGTAAEFVVAAPGVACALCAGRGYRGRISIIEVLPTAGLEQRLAERAPPEELLRAFRERGCRTLFEDGVRKASLGLATMEDICAAVEAPPGLLL